MLDTPPQLACVADGCGQHPTAGVSVQGDAAAAAAWGLVQGLQRDLSNMASALCGSHGGSSSRQLAMCLAGIKMCEQAVLHYTADSTSVLAPAVAQGLQAEANRLIQALLELLAGPRVKQHAGPVVIGAVKALGQLCLQRPTLLTVLLPPLLTLAQQVCVLKCACQIVHVFACGSRGTVSRPEPLQLALCKHATAGE